MVAELTGRTYLPQQGGPSGNGRRPAMPWILMYHSVADEEEDPYLLTVSPGRFAQQMRWLAVRGWRGVSVRELLAARAAGRRERLVGLTFDDGYADFAGHVVPVLSEHGFTATAFVVTERLGDVNCWDAEGPRKPLLTERQVCELAAAGWEIGSHGMSHLALPEVPPGVLRAEVEGSRTLLTELLGEPVRGFCYPYGALDAAAIRAVQRAGYDYAVAIRHSALAGRYALPRCYVGDRDGAWRLRAKRGRHGLREVIADLRRRGAAE
ncbi:polysaccharide deacetylase family protein [Kitasatospora acidiphila]|uniref:Polysaccharide deacetylase family protein n=1 Tax=Kitasatospora acidiphila TaxID=2567942 RepID=A0A540W1T5_9ACTN|nr:polysaccharide deacetylase family protein [Kitasatospora acidiphila]TQF02985.1 polysaccharide deacetylase family protein [Kitasatospora acidiphila]